METTAKLHSLYRAIDRYNRIAMALPAWDKSGYRRATDRANVLEEDAIALRRTRKAVAA